MADICIIGGGIQGCSTALALAKAGADVVVIERDYPGRHASGVNAGGIRIMWRDLPEVPLSIASHQRWMNIEELVDDDCEVVISANISIAETEEELAAARKHVQQLCDLGYNHESIISPQEVLEIEPAIEAEFSGAVYCPGDGFANPFKATQAFFNKAQSLGVRFYLQETVQSVTQQGSGWLIKTDKQDHHCQTLVNCAGAWSNQITSALGAPCPVSKAAPMLMVTARTAPFMNSVLGFEKRRLSLKQASNGTVIIGGGYRGRVDESGTHGSLNVAELKEAAQTAMRLYPFLQALPVVRAWTGIESMTPDRLPVIGRCSEHDNVFHAFGFSAHGFQLGPIVGEILCDLIVSGKTSLPIEAFSINRFR